jgi:hypothetical protein
MWQIARQGKTVNLGSSPARELTCLLSHHESAGLEDSRMNRVLTRTFPALSAAVVLLFAASAEADGIERSRGPLIEVMPLGHNQLFKHDISLARVDTDSYPNELFVSAYRSDGRFYQSGDRILRIGNSADDTLQFFSDITRHPFRPSWCLVGARPPPVPGLPLPWCRNLGATRRS